MGKADPPTTIVVIENGRCRKARYRPQSPGTRNNPGPRPAGRSFKEAGGKGKPIEVRRLKKTG